MFSVASTGDNQHDDNNIITRPARSRQPVVITLPKNPVDEDDSKIDDPSYAFTNKTYNINNFNENKGIVL